MFEKMNTLSAEPTTTSIIKRNWFSRDLNRSSEEITTFLVLLLLGGAVLFFNNFFGATDLMPATVQGVFTRGEYWRLWTALFAHADLGHLLSNLLLFVPLGYFLNGYFGSFLFPVLGFVLGGVGNYLTLKTMGSQGSLIGVSGVVFWMGAAWLTLYVLLETKESLRRRLGKALFIGAALFLPQSFEPNISYMCHLFGFISGFATALVYYFAQKKKFAKAEIRELVIEYPEAWELEAEQLFAVTPLEFKPAPLGLEPAPVAGETPQEPVKLEPFQASDSRCNPFHQACRT
jgi:rhomboid protease GluP